MSIYKVGHIGTKEIAVEEAMDARAACYKAGWAPQCCEVIDISDQVIVLNENSLFFHGREISEPPYDRPHKTQGRKGSLSLVGTKVAKTFFKTGRRKMQKKVSVKR